MLDGETGHGMLREAGDSSPLCHHCPKGTWSPPALLASPLGPG